MSPSLCLPTPVCLRLLHKKFQLDRRFLSWLTADLKRGVLGPDSLRLASLTVEVATQSWHTHKHNMGGKIFTTEEETPSRIAGPGWRASWRTVRPHPSLSWRWKSCGSGPSRRMTVSTCGTWWSRCRGGCRRSWRAVAMPPNTSQRALYVIFAFSNLK